MKTPILTRLLPLVLLALTGCGGGGGHHTTASSAIQVVFSNESSTYDGSKATLGGSASLSGTGPDYQLALEDGDRSLSLGFTLKSLANGATVDLSKTGDGAGAILYFEGGHSDDKTWRSTSGTLTFSDVTATSATITLSGVMLSPFALLPDLSTGSFQMDGPIVASLSTERGEKAVRKR